jgi:SAM-dependent methyltransferase
MNIDWRLKSSVFGAIDRLRLYRALYFLQKNVTRHSRVHIHEPNPDWITHRRHLSGLERPRVIEFGAGHNLAQNIYLSRFFGAQTLVDMYPMLDLALFNEAARQIAGILGHAFRPVASVEDIRREYDIDYRAPVDMTRCGFADDEFDACISTATLEHIPRDTIVGIFRELKRVVREEGLVSAVIDYTDHYSYTDRSISALNFLSFSSRDFSRHNHESHYQNRLRHYHFEQMFAALGFETVRSEALNKAAPPARVSEEFDRGEDSVFATRGHFLLRVHKA